MSPKDARDKLTPLFRGCMKGRTMYVIPYLMGPVGSRASRVGVEISDSAYVVANMRIMTRMGKVALDALGTAKDFVKGLHSTGDLSPERRAKLAAFLHAAFAAKMASREAMRRELEVGREAMAHVLEIIGQQQQQAHERPVLERCDVSEIVARNAAIARYSDGASIAFSFPADPHAVMANRVIPSQVIGNLLGNAAESIAATGRDTGSIGVTIEEAGDTIVVRIRDDGEGFDVATGATLFQRGFSTREHKSGGLGLHWCANSMTAMEGSLRLESDGKGLGASAVLTLRAAAAEAIARAA